jgi:RimJ/RimL family protein N-acetyltransferase
MPTFTHLTLSTQRLLLRPLGASDAPGVMALFTDAAFMQFGTAPPFASMEEADALITRDVQAMANGERLRFGIELLADHALIGICTLFHLDPQCRSAEIGYGLLSDAWGRGYMHESLVTLLDYGFGDLGLNRVEADIDPRNTRSAKSLERAGFIQEGLLRESCIVNGVLTDSARYGLLRREWLARPKVAIPGAR